MATGCPGEGIGPTVAELAERYLREHVANLHHSLRKTPVAANEAVGALSRMFNQAEAWGLIPAGSNPSRFVAKFRARRLDRFLTEEEFRRIGEALDGLQAEGRPRYMARRHFRLLMVTGCRSDEILDLRWEEVLLDRSEIRLADSKTGPRTVPLLPAAAKVLADLPRLTGNPWVIAGRKPGTRLAHISHYWYRVQERAGLEDVRIHDLRHRFACMALALGEPLAMIGKLLGHSKIQDDGALCPSRAPILLRQTAARAAASIGADILPGDSPPISVQGARRET